MKLNISSILRVVVSLCLIFLLIWMMRDGLWQVLDELKTANMAIFLACFIIFVLIIYISSIRLKLIFKDERIDIPTKYAVQLTYVGYFFNNFMPGAIGGDIVKAIYVSRDTNQKARSFVCIFMDRFIGLFSFIMLGMLALVFSWNEVEPTIKGKVVLALLCSFCAIFMTVNVRVAKLISYILSKLKFMDLGNKLTRFYDIVHNYRNKTALLQKTVVLSIVTQCIYFIMIFILALALGLNINIKLVFLIMPIVSVISILPSVGGLGLREFAMVVLFGPTIGRENAFSLSLLLLGVLILVSFVGGLIYLLSPQFKFKSADNEKGAVT